MELCEQDRDLVIVFSVASMFVSMWKVYIRLYKLFGHTTINVSLVHRFFFFSRYFDSC